VQLIEPLIDWAFEKFDDPKIIDMGAGKSYLGFLVYDLLLREKAQGQLYAVEHRQELVERSKKLALNSNFNRMHFFEAAIENFNWPGDETPALVMALHACDTATDDALYFGLKNKALSFAVVPCCQAEVSRLLEKSEENDISSLWDFPLHRREFGSHLTNVIRVLTLKSLGYSVTVTELVGWEHSLKNELILARKTGQKNLKAEKQLQNLIQKSGVRSKLIRLLEK
jgi:hypothetical protein